MSTSLVLLPPALLYEVCGFLDGRNVAALICCRGLRSVSLVEGGLRRVMVTGGEDPMLLHSLFDRMASLKGLRILHVHEVGVEEGLGGDLARVVKGSGLEVLSLWANGMAQEDEGTEALGRAVREGGGRRLQGMYVRDNWGGCVCLVRALGVGACVSLVRLSLCGNGLGEDDLDPLYAAIAQHHLPHLQKLDLQSNALSDGTLTRLATAATEAQSLGHVCVIREVHLGFNALGDEGCTALAHALSGGAWPLLEEIDLSYNTVGDAGAGAWGVFLASGGCPRLESLDLRANRVGDAGAQAIHAQLVPTEGMGQKVPLRETGTHVWAVYLDGNLRMTQRGRDLLAQITETTGIHTIYM